MDNYYIRVRRRTSSQLALPKLVIENSYKRLPSISELSDDEIDLENEDLQIEEPLKNKKRVFGGKYIGTINTAGSNDDNFLEFYESTLSQQVIIDANIDDENAISDDYLLGDDENEIYDYYAIEKIDLSYYDQEGIPKIQMNLLDEVDADSENIYSEDSNAESYYGNEYPDEDENYGSDFDDEEEDEERDNFEYFDENMVDILY
eukprot:TRINITY_DN398_c0_g1_i1.p1 TRINITY_DN398_c0_g1~~TRINITY_DN398_c0_g1_i1.p1  ORF type:complete len:204 (-),score=78.21 TRINITY_DN398_c0_g1_i1:77-688(-)